MASASVFGRRRCVWGRFKYGKRFLRLQGPIEGTAEYLEREGLSDSDAFYDNTTPFQVAAPTEFANQLSSCTEPKEPSRYLSLADWPPLPSQNDNYLNMSGTTHPIRPSSNFILELYPYSAERQWTSVPPVDTPLAWPQVFEVPTEIWGEIAVLSGLRAIARLCAVSQSFYSTFSPILYGRMVTTDPALTREQTTLLTNTLRHPSAVLKNLNLSPRPGMLVQSLCLPSVGYRSFNLADYIGALRGLVETQCPFLEVKVARGAALRTLKWDSGLGINELGALLLTPGDFPNLKKLSVNCIELEKLSPDKPSHTFDILRLPNLEKLECSFKAQIWSGDYKSGDTSVYEEWRPTWCSLRQIFEALPVSSPHLHTLVLQLTLNSYDSPWEVDLN
ncbi:hypothetical protein B0H16DRAFT_1892023, partial [Mycena metata]